MFINVTDRVIKIIQSGVNNQLFIIFWEMFKTNTVKQHTPQVMSNQLLSFLARQINILKDVSSSITTKDKSISQNKLQECIHLIQKKIVFSVSEDPEHYHDYIQDFYDNQVTILRNELEQLKMQISLRDRELQEQRQNFQIIQNRLNQRQRQEQSSINFQEFYQVKIQLEQSKLLISQNSKLLNEQNDTIKTLSEQLKTNQKQFNKSRKEYESKILRFQEFTRKNKEQFDFYFRELQQKDRTSQQTLKEMSINSLRAIESSSNLGKQLEIKLQEIRLFTKKLFDADLLIAKYQREITLKDRTIEEMSEQIQICCRNQDQLKIRGNQFKTIIYQKQTQNRNLQTRISLLNTTNSQIERSLHQKQTRMDALEKQYKGTITAQQKEIKARLNLEKQLQQMLGTIREKDSTILKSQHERSKLNDEIRLLQERISQLQYQNKTLKENMKNSILSQVEQLVQITQQQKQNIKNLNKQIQSREKYQKKLCEANTSLQQKLNTITDVMGDITTRLNRFQVENRQLLISKTMIEEENIKKQNQIEMLILQQKDYSILKKHSQHLETKLKKYQQSADNYSNERVRQLEQFLKSYQIQIKLNKELIIKKDFQSRQFQSKIKILQQDLQSISLLYENQKSKMGKKIRELQELLKQDATSRKSSSGANKY